MFAVYTFFLPVNYLPLKNIIGSNDLKNLHNKINYKNNGFIKKNVTLFKSHNYIHSTKSKCWVVSLINISGIN